MDRQKILEAIEANRHNRVQLAVCDIDGILRGKIVLKEKFKEAVDSSFGFCDVIFGWDCSDTCYTNNATTGWHTAYPDARAVIDPATFREVPWNDSIPFFLADFEQDSRIADAACPRTLLKRVIQKASAMNLLPIFAQEFEWFNFIREEKNTPQNLFAPPHPITSGMFGYSLLRPALYRDYFNDLFDKLADFGVPLEGLHTETGPGVYEAAIRYDGILAAADKAVLFKTGVREIACSHDITASFMAKWSPNHPGCSGHIHQSLWDTTRETNLFLDPNAENGMSRHMQHYLAGILHCLPEILPMFAPTVNSYKRLREGTWAPTSVSWGIENRTAAVRVIPGEAKNHRLELRVPGSDSNPYLAMAASLAAGLWGIRNKLPLEQTATVGNAYTDADLTRLPTTLHEATQKMKASQLAAELFGKAFVQHFCTTREWEWQQHCAAVTDWELGRYFEII